MSKKERLKSAVSRPQNGETDGDFVCASFWLAPNRVYEILGKDSPEFETIARNVRMTLELRSWFGTIARFDPVDGKALPQSSMEVFEQIRRFHGEKHPELKDRFFRILEHTAKAIRLIASQPREKILREHAVMPLHAVREIDGKSLQWLAKRPGRTVREKLARKPFLNGVRRRSSIDTPENRLLKEFITQVERILVYRNAAIPPNEIESRDGERENMQTLTELLKRWLQNDEHKEIGDWNAWTPNNVLLQDKLYKKVWDAWGWLQHLESGLKRDYARRYDDWMTVLYWSILAKLQQETALRFIQQPLWFDDENFILSDRPQDSKIAKRIRFVGYPRTTNVEHRQKGKIIHFEAESDKKKLIASFDGFGIIELFGTEIFQSGKPFSHISSPDLEFTVSDLLDIEERRFLEPGVEVTFAVETQGKKSFAKKIAVHYEPNAFTIERIGNNEIRMTDDRRTFSIIQKNDQLKIVEKGKPEERWDICLEQIGEIAQKAVLFAVDGRSPLPKTPPSQPLSEKKARTIIDLCSNRPQFHYTSEEITVTDHLPFRFIQQYWGDQKIPLDCGRAELIKISAHSEKEAIETISMTRLLRENRPRINPAAMLFIDRLKDFMRCDRFACLFPDWVDDLQDEPRRSINLHFPAADLLPRSIAAAYAWIRSNAFEKSSLKKDTLKGNVEGHVLFVLDNVRDGISVTPVEVEFNPKLAEQVEETYGLFWKRHPTEIVPVKEGKTVSSQIKAILGKNELAEKLVDLFSVDDFVDIVDNLAFTDADGHLFELPKELKTKNFPARFSRGDLEKSYDFLFNSARVGRKFHFLPLSRHIAKPDGFSISGIETSWLEPLENLIEGGRRFFDCRDRVNEIDDEIDLWSDHLPELLTRIPNPDGYREKFYFVGKKEKNIRAKKGERTPITVGEFKLRAGPDIRYYTFPLIQGSGSRTTHKAAYLVSQTDFPLSRDMTCRLRMTYEYGADQPYELVFEPVSPIGNLKPWPVQWRDLGSLDYSVRPAIGFPPKPTWEELCYGEKGDLISYFSRVANQLDDEESIRKTRFPMFLIWYGARSILNDHDIPSDFKKTVEKIRKSALDLYLDYGYYGRNPGEKDIQKELLYFLCRMHRDMPEEITEKMIDESMTRDGTRKFHRELGYVLGDLACPWQQEIWNNILTRLEDAAHDALFVLGTALWRCRDLVCRLSEENIHTMASTLLYCLRKDIKEYDAPYTGRIPPETQLNIRQQYLTRHLEALLALFRTKEGENLLAPDTEYAHNLLAEVDLVAENIALNGWEIKSVLPLGKKPDAFRKMPDLLYGLIACLTGDRGTGSLQLSYNPTE